MNDAFGGYGGNIQDDAFDETTAPKKYDKTGVLELCAEKAVCEEPKVCQCVDYVTRPVPEYISVDQFIPTIIFAASGKDGGIDSNIARTYVIRAAQGIARRTSVLVRVFDINPERCVNDYYLCNDDLERINLIEQVIVDGYAISREAFVGDNSRFRFNPPNQIIVYDANCHIEVVASVVPSERSCMIDSVLFYRYRTAVEALALSYIYAIPNTDWFNYNMSAFKKIEAQNLIGQISKEMYGGFHSGVRDLSVNLTF